MDGADGLTVLNEEIGGVPVVVVPDPDSMFGMAFSTVVDGTARTFSAGDGLLVDDSGATWSLEGVGDDERLTFVTGFVTEWYGWAAYQTDTGIWPDWRGADGRAVRV